MLFLPTFRYEEFMEASGRLNDLANYTQLMELSERIGYAVSKVVFRGYQAGDKLQVSSTNFARARTGSSCYVDASLFFPA